MNPKPFTTDWLTRRNRDVINSAFNMHLKKLTLRMRNDAHIKGLHHRHPFGYAHGEQTYIAAVVERRREAALVQARVIAETGHVIRKVTINPDDVVFDLDRVASNTVKPGISDARGGGSPGQKGNLRGAAPNIGKHTT